MSPAKSDHLEGDQSRASANPNTENRNRFSALHARFKLWSAVWLRLWGTVWLSLRLQGSEIVCLHSRCSHRQKLQKPQSCPWRRTTLSWNSLQTPLFFVHLQLQIKKSLGAKCRSIEALSTELRCLSLISMFQNCATLRCSLWLFRSWCKSFFPVPLGTRSETWPRRPRAGF